LYPVAVQSHTIRKNTQNGVINAVMYATVLLSHSDEALMASAYAQIANLSSTSNFSAALVQGVLNANEDILLAEVMMVSAEVTAYESESYFHQIIEIESTRCLLSSQLIYLIFYHYTNAISAVKTPVEKVHSTLKRK